MSWRDELREPSFRGVPFHVDSASSDFGRRIIPHEYPLRDLPYVEDMGRKLRQLRVEAILIGPDYMAARDALIAAIEQPGPGKLVHPYYGELQASVASFLVAESSREGGMARISIDFLESGEATFPAANADTRRLVSERVEAATDVGIEGFADRFAIDGLPGFAQASPVAIVNGLLDQVLQLGAVPLGDALARGTLNGLVDSLRDRVGGLLDSPLQLATEIVAIVRALRSVGPSPAQSLVNLAQLGQFGASLPAVSPITATRQREAANQVALIEMIQVAAVAQAAAALVEVTFESFDQAVDLRERILEPLDAIADVTLDDAVVGALANVRAAVVRDVAVRGADLARQVQYTPPATVPALVIAYALYEDVGREADILARNAIAHPGFVPAGQVLEVLTDG
jgi:prophage DNA circulation protein